MVNEPEPSAGEVTAIGVVGLHVGELVGRAAPTLDVVDEHVGDVIAGVGPHGEAMLPPAATSAPSTGDPAVVAGGGMIVK